ncbi:MAG: cytochrome c biogenesis protein CcsA [Alphaproteobacteria bacterium]
MATLGLLALAAGLAASLVQGSGLLWCRLFSLSRALQIARASLLLSAQMVAVAFVCLLVSFWRNDFSLAVVAGNSHSLLGDFWRLAAAWGNHEGSLLLWILLLSITSLALLTLSKAPRSSHSPLLPLAALSIQGWLSFLFLCFSLFFSNPFARLEVAALEGADLNPILQDPALVFHPPLLYLGYVGLSLSWTIVAAGLIVGSGGAALARLARPWALAAWSALTAGLALGSWWAYYELGWGGWWFWDPVENLALMPWLVATAQVHALAAASRGRFVAGALLLSLLGFLLALLATFSVRSGLLVSVHSFAIAPARGLAALAILALAGVFSLGLFALRAASASSSRPSAAGSHPSAAGSHHSHQGNLDGHDAAFLFNLLLLPSLGGVVLVGTFYPLAADIFLGLRLSVGEGYYALAFVPLSLTLLLGAGLTPAWPRKGMLAKVDAKAEIYAAILRARWGWGALVVCLLAISFMAPETSWLARIAAGLGVWLMVESLCHIGRFWAARRHSPDSTTIRPTRARRPTRTTRNQYLGLLAMVVAHFAFGLFVFSAAVSRSWQWERSALLAPGERIVVPRHSFELESVRGVVGANWVAEEGRVVWQKDGELRAVLNPQRRFYPAAVVTTTETAIVSTPLYDFHLRLGEEGNTGRRVVVLYRPLTSWLWLSASLMVLAGLCAFFVQLSSQRNSQRRGKSAEGGSE